MPIFEIETPDGRILEIEGDTLPNEQEMDEIFKNYGVEQKKLNPFTATKEELNDEYKRQGQAQLDKRIEWEENHPIISRLQADYQPFYRSDRTAMEQQAQYGFDIPIKEALKNTAVETGQAAIPFVNAGRDAVLSVLTQGKAGFIPTLLKNAGIAAVQSGTADALDELSNNGVGNVLERTLEGGKTGGKYGAGISALLQTIPYVGEGLSRATVSAIKNPKVQDLITSGLELMTSVPKRSSQIALDNELAGTSILNKPFDAKTAYQPIEKMVKNAKNALPSPAEFGNDYYQLGQKALQGMENLEQNANEGIRTALGNLSNNAVDIKGLKNAVNTVINKLGNGGEFNPAEIKAGKDLLPIKNLLENPETKPINLHNAKEFLYDTANYETAGGIKNKALKQVANQINNYLRGLSPDYAKANDIASVVKNVIKGLDSNTTMGSKLKNIGSTESAISGLDQRLKAVDNLLPQNNKFYKQAENIIENENEINNIRNQISKVYERNPRLLLTKTDDAFTQAFEDLQKKTGMNIRKPLEEIQAREHFSKLLPGQGGGSGSAQGAGNLSRAQVFAKSLEKAMTGDIRPLVATALMSPLIGGKGTISNIGKMYTQANKYLNAPKKDITQTLPTINAIISKLSQY